MISELEEPGRDMPLGAGCVLASRVRGAGCWHETFRLAQLEHGDSRLQRSLRDLHDKQDAGRLCNDELGLSGCHSGLGILFFPPRVSEPEW
jgi:hypothetical protein